MAATGPYAGSQGDNGYPGPRSMAAMPSIDDLRQKALSEVKLTRDSSLDALLSEAGQANRLVTSHQEFGHPDRAYIEWLKADQFIHLIVRNPDSPFMNEHRKNIFTHIQTVHANQRSGMTAIEIKIKESYARASSNINSVASAKPGSRQAVYSPTEPTSNGTSQANRHTFYDTTGSGGVTNGAGTISHPASLRPMSSPQDDPLVARFQRMRASNGSKDQTSPSIPESLRPGRPSVSIAADNSTKPAGPRPMPLDKELPSTPPRLSTKALLESLPRAPSPIYTPIRGTQNPNATPPRASTMPYADSRGNRIRERKPFPELPARDFIEAEELFSRLREFKLLLIDLRDREKYDAGHIHGKSVVCVEPLSLKPGMSLDQLKEDGMLYAPDEEVAHFDKLRDYDLVVYYDQDTSSTRFLQGSPQPGPSLHMRYLFDTLTIFNEETRLQRDPVFLKGGLNAWIDLVSENALQTSRTGAPDEKKQNAVQRKPHRKSLVGSRSVRDVRSHRLAHWQPPSADETGRLREQVERQTSEAPDLSDYRTQDGEASVAAQSERQLFVPIQSVNDYLVQASDPTRERQSMTSPTYPSNGYNPARSRQAPPPPYDSGIPARPPPIASRPSYSGVSDQRAGPPASLGNRDIATPARRQPLVRDIFLHRSGLVNYGSTCYMNSVIQCLSATIPLTMFFSQKNWEVDHLKDNWKGSSTLMPKAYANLIREMWKSAYGDRPSAIVVAPRTFQELCHHLDRKWDKHTQQDAHEFLMTVLDILHEDLNKQFDKRPLKELSEEEERYRESQAKWLVSKKEWQRSRHLRQSPVDDIFALQYASQVACTKCHTTSTTHQTLSGLELSIPRRSVPTSLQDIIREYCKEEEIDFDCKRCGSAKARKKLSLTRLPHVLVLTFSRYNMHRQKIETPIDFPLTGLKMDEYMADTRPRPGDELDPAVTPPFNFDCYAIINHIGETPNAGHYFAVCKDSGRNKWREFNDRKVYDFDPMATQKFKNPKQAYIVFYERAVPR